MIPTKTSARSTAPRMPTLTPESTACRDTCRGHARRLRPSGVTNGSIRARIRSTRWTPRPLSILALAWAGGVP